MSNFRQKVEDYHKKLSHEKYESQEKAVGSAIQLLRESINNFRELKGAVRSRHKSAFRILSDILQSPDQDQARINFVYCSCCFSPSQLGTIAPKASFVEDFQRWTRAVTFPASFLTTAQRLYRQHQVILDQHMQIDAKRKRSEDEALAEPTKRRRAYVPTALDSYSSDDEELGHEPDPKFVDGPLDGPVYELKAIDVMRAAIAEDNKNPGFQLTMPDFPGQRPFITFRCPETLANALLQKRERIL